MSSWIDFKELRKKLKLEAVLKFYSITLSRKGTTDQFVGPCPLPKHMDKRGAPFSANLERGMWQCFGCKESGGVLDLAVLMEGHDKRDGRKVNSVAAKMQRELLKTDEKKPAAPPKSAPSPTSSKRTVVNQPLDFQLKTLETEHPYFAEHKLSAETVAHFGLGFCKRGALTGRIAVPLVDDAQQLVAYTGLVVDESQITDSNPRYLYPPPREIDDVLHVFDRTKFLYGGFRIPRAAKDLIVVRECHTVWKLWQGGFGNVVALMGDSCADEQAELVNLLTPPNGRIWFLSDSSDASRVCAISLTPKIASSRLCRWIRVETEADMAPDHPLVAALAKR